MFVLWDYKSNIFNSNSNVFCLLVTYLYEYLTILAWYDCLISTIKVEGINNKIKIIKRNAYGFRNERYFKLRLYALHDYRITL